MSAAPDAGFICSDCARAAVRRMKLRRLLTNAEVLISATLDCLDQASEPLGSTQPVHIDGCTELGARDIAGRIGGQSIDRSESDDVSEQQLLEGADLFLQFLDTLFDALTHGRFSLNHSDNPEATSARLAAHRLSEEISHT